MSTVVNFSDIISRWSLVLEKIKNRKITVHAWLMDGQPVSFMDSTLIVKFNNIIHMENVKKPNNIEIIESVLFEVFKDEITIECVKSDEIIKHSLSNTPVVYSYELLFVLENGTRLSTFTTFVNLLNLDDKYIVNIVEEDSIRCRGTVTTNLEELNLEIQLNKYTANDNLDLVYKMVIYGYDVLVTAEYMDHVIDLFNNRKEVKSKYLLWDGISQYYCNQAYNLINQVENRMRSFIMEFLCRKIGQHAFQKTLSNEIKVSIDNNNQKTPFIGFNTSLFNMEFRELGEFLFKEFDDFKDREQLIQEIKKCSTIDQLSILQSRLPNSNWNKYFKDTVENNKLQTNWNKLIIYRNIVAHNKILTKSEYDNLSEIVREILSELENAIESLNSLSINDDEQKKISSNLEQIITFEVDCEKCHKTFQDDEIDLLFIEDELVFLCKTCGKK